MILFYVVIFLVKLVCVNKDFYVWDFVMGLVGLFVVVMNEMLIDVKNSIIFLDELC